ncbi:DNA-formamidopyrimidine glycosylase family protein [Streptomyces sp. CoH27]|uniref:DNA-formamidopyrimidine glycosylase family protein n=1 Tax=Streptomyces sp. CoH27 TaxID=2875763 RepID=UPI0027DEB309|nr:DNA-formamidopyrimidine glycosylase family protein [Streptomyces sp. CoH27]
MPELPDVEGYREVLNTCGRGRRVRRVDVRDTGVLRGVGARHLRREVEGQRLGRPWRHGKLLVVPFGDGPALVWHFGMTGELVCTGADDPLQTHDRVVLALDDERQLRTATSANSRASGSARTSGRWSGCWHGWAPTPWRWTAPTSWSCSPGGGAPSRAC